jgi:predicted GNAT family N-acyltransferase
MTELENQAKKRGYKGVQLAAQLQATPFYCSLGYESVGKIFMDAGIEHRLMRLHF